MRPAQAGDELQLEALWDEVEALHARLQPAFFAPPPAVGSTLGRGRSFRRGQHEVVLVALDAGGIVRGLASVRLYDTPRSPELLPARRAYLEDLIVERAHRRSGCGRALVEAGQGWARERGARQLLLTVWQGNAQAARFYAALGYRRISQVLGTDL